MLIFYDIYAVFTLFIILYKLRFFIILLFMVINILLIAANIAQSVITYLKFEVLFILII